MRRARARVSAAALVFGLGTALGGAVALGAPDALRAFLWAAGLGAGDAPASLVASRLAPLLLAGAGSLFVVALVVELAGRSRVPKGAAVAAIAVLFLADAARRVAGTCPAGDPGLYDRATPGVRLVLAESARGRFFDDAADRPDVAVRRAREAGGLDPLRAATSALFGIRSAGDNDVDRMTPLEAVAWAREMARLPWGREKVARLSAAGVATARTPVLETLPEGTAEIARLGGDVLLRLTRTRPEFVLLLEGRGASGELRRYGPGVVTILERHPALVRLRVVAGEPGGLLAIARTYDPNWTVVCDGAYDLTLLRAEGFLTAVEVPAGAHTVEMRYTGRLFLWGGASTLVCAVVLAMLLAGPRLRLRERWAKIGTVKSRRRGPAA